MLTTRKRL